MVTPLTWTKKYMVDYAPHYNLVMITSQIGQCKIARILVDEGNDFGILFSNYFERMGIPQDIIISNDGGVYNYDDN